MRTTLRENRVFIIVLIILGFSAYNSITDQVEMHQHHDFFTKMSKFAETGARFTAQDGMDLCDEINKMKFDYTDLDLMDCERYDKDVQ